MMTMDQTTTADLWKPLTVVQKYCVQGYLEAALDSSDLDSKEIHDFSRSALISAIKDCCSFLADNMDSLQKRHKINAVHAGFSVANHVGRDLWLARNQMIAGFGDENLWGGACTRLVLAAEKYGKVDVWEDDSDLFGLVYFS